MGLFSSLALTLGVSIVGQWQFYKMEYRGNELPPRDPNLVLTYEFAEDMKSHMLWYYKNDLKHRCERRGEFEYQDGILSDTATWIDPENHISCSQDPDMRLGTVSVVPLVLHESGDLYMKLPFNGEFLYYVWKRTDLENNQ